MVSQPDSRDNERILSAAQRSALERAVVNARGVAEGAALEALALLAVNQKQPFPSLGREQRALRLALRADLRRLGDDEEALVRLAEEAAYVQWHRMLFARFLAENELLLNADRTPVTLAECRELAAELGETNPWNLATRYAAVMLPGIFRPDDPLSQLSLTPEGRRELEAIVEGIGADTFQTDDALGWVYQFWQARRKDEVNASGRKIGGADLAPVTQLFTEHYMVRFLLENSLGAWWAAHHPDSRLQHDWRYLRYKDDGTPAAGSFPGWPATAAEVTVIDPCCGSGHFLVEAFAMLQTMRQEEQGLSLTEAGDAALRDNLFGLEIDPRCTQIAAFALAFAAWRSGGYRPMPELQLACSGLAVTGALDEWMRLAGDDDRLQRALQRLHRDFSNAPELGSLINPADLPLNERMFTAEYAEVAPLLQQALSSERGADPAAAVFGAAAEGVAKAGRILAGTYTLVVTNPPYLVRGKQTQILRAFTEQYFSNAKGDLAIAFLERCKIFAGSAGTCACVLPQNWLSQGMYEGFRRDLIGNDIINVIVKLGPAAFQDMNWWAANTILIIVTTNHPLNNHRFIGIDISSTRITLEKPYLLLNSNLKWVPQLTQISNPDARLVIDDITNGELLSKYTDSYWGLGTGDAPRYTRYFWELSTSKLEKDWIFQLGSVETTTYYSGREHILFWQEGKGQLANDPGASIRATQIWGKQGVLVSQMGKLPITLYTGEAFDQNCSPIIPENPTLLPALWSFCASSEFNQAVRRIDQALKVTNATLVKVPFDLERWQALAEEAGPLPEPYSGDPTQWLFKGLPVELTSFPPGVAQPASVGTLQVMVARLLGYRWPAEDESQAEQLRLRYTGDERRLLRTLDRLSDSDGIVPLPAVAGEQPSAARLLTMLRQTYGSAWSPHTLDQLLAEAGAGKKSLAVWLRDDFFAQHCKLFQNRPFIWQIWDGRKDGFAALLNYHRLNRASLEKLIYTYLGDWISQQRRLVAEQDPQAEGRLADALVLQGKLEAILTGEPPYDIYVRWKQIYEQPLGWEPDLNDGVRLNIRPFVEAAMLRSKVNIKWGKDRGTNPDGSERINDRHHTRQEKIAAREAAAREAPPPSEDAQEGVEYMYLRKVAIRNIKHIADMELSFTGADGKPRMWTTILGPNGSGKSTILQAIGTALAGPRNRGGKVFRFVGWVRHGKGYGEISVEVIRDTIGDGPAGETTLRTLMDLPILGARYVVTGNNPALLPSVIDSQDTNALMAWPDGEGAPPGQKHLIAALRNARRGWFVCGYGPYRRLYGGSESEEYQVEEGREDALVTLFTEARALGKVEGWLRTLYYQAHDERDKEEQRLKKQGQPTEAIPAGLYERRLAQVRAIFREHFLPDPSPVELVIEADSIRLQIGAGAPVPFAGLSDGYRSMLALGGDLLRQLSEAYPDAEELTDCPGIVLIDELDAHAHPAWQREIGHWLRKKFPRLQFIITTHSPFLAQVADEPGGNIVLKLGEEGVRADPQEETAEDWRVDQVLTLFFGLDSPRSPLFEQRREKLGRLLMRPEQQLSTDERRELEQLRIWAQQLPPANETREGILRAKEIQQESEELADQIRELE